MGLFTPDRFEISDEEAMLNALPRSGLRGFFETLGDYFPQLFKANLLTCCCMLLPILLFGLGRILTNSILLTGALALLSAPLAGAGLCALNAVVCESIRNRGYRFNTVFQTHFRENLRKGTFPGMLYILAIECTLYASWLARLEIDLSGLGGTMLMLCMLAAMIKLLLAYMLPMMTLVDLPVRHYLKNSLLMIPVCLKTSFFLLMIPCALYFLVMFCLPASGIYILLCAFSLHTLCAQMWVWPETNRLLSIEVREQEKNS